MELDNLYTKALNREFLDISEGFELYENAPIADLMFIANEIRKFHKPGNTVGWIIDRNVNITNVCISKCKFCNFYRKPAADDAFITTMEEYDQKIATLFERGGNQLLLQGGCHPKLGIEFYTDLFSQLKARHPKLKLHSLGPAEIVHISRISKLSYREVLEKLTAAGLDSLPGAGAEILDDDIRKSISPGKCSASEWLNVMREAHKLNITTSATMMFGHVETKRHRMEHLIKLRDVQAEKPEGSEGFTTFIPWTFQGENTELQLNNQILSKTTGEDYVRMLAMSRIMLPNIKNIQASWLTVGKEIAQICLHGGANDFGSIMIEENVVSAAGANHQFDEKGIQDAIRQAGFMPQLRDQKYMPVDKLL
jgi:cyclic dehypoxanthinyl futalosine synthase